MGFFRRQEEQLAARFLVWQYRRIDLPEPEPEALRRHAAEIVEEAHRIARRRGKNVVAIIKELIADLKKTE